MKHKSLHLFLLLMLLFPGCNEKELNDTVNTESKGIPMSFYASIESPRDTVTTKTALGGTSDDYTRKVLWESQDAIYVTNGTSYSRFTNKTEGNSETAEFAGTISQGSDYYAAFPYSMVTGFSSSSFQITLPSTQTYKADGIASDIFPMVAQCTDGFFSFMNLCGILVLNLTGTAEISSITFFGTDEDGNQMMVSGNATVSAAYSDFPVLKMASNANSQVVLDCMDSNGKGVSLNSSKATPFHIVLPAANYSGFTIVVKTVGDEQMTISSNKSLSIVRSKRTVASGIKYESDKYEYVDLGLSVNWATCNVGAYKPEEYGDYYAWGEIVPYSGKSDKSWSSYKWRNGSSGITKYNTKNNYGTVDNKITLEPSDDVAYVMWGGKWRMPTSEEFAELLYNCDWVWYDRGNSQFGGVAGYKVISYNYTNRFIFLPVRNTGWAEANDKYWSSSLDSVSPSYAWNFSLSFADYDGVYQNYGYGLDIDSRNVGQSIRPVCPSDTWMPTLSLNRASVSLDIGESVKLSATAKNNGFILSYPITWSSDNLEIAFVDQDGNVKALSLGTAIVTAIVKGVKASCTITVTDKTAPECVDLGLSVKWATCNIGASKPENYGNYYAWGETETKTTYSWSNYKWCKGSDNSMTKYCNKSSYGNNGFTDTKTTLDPEDDVAHVKWGGSWRMPAIEEFQELIDNCNWIWTTMNGVEGYNVTSMKSGYTDRSIFLPAAGLYDAVPRSAGSYGSYWSGSLDTDYPDGAWGLYFFSDRYGTTIPDRYTGRSVRPVCPSETWVPVTSLSLDRTSLSLETGESVKLSATARKDGDVVSYSVSWSSDNTAIATVDQDGNVKALSSGTAIITAICDGVKASCTVTVTKKSQGPEYVDLGLNVKWATFNVGASKPEEYGDYYAWGETEPKTTYYWSTYKWCKGSYKTLTKYCNNSDLGNNGFTDTKTTLDPEDDVAHVKWGGSWRMPTRTEFDELRSNCTWTWTTMNGVKGYKVTSKKSGYTDRSIFLPAAGYRYETLLLGVGSYGRYWSSSLDTDYPDGAWYLGFDSGSHYTGTDYRYRTLFVRPVLP